MPMDRLSRAVYRELLGLSSTRERVGRGLLLVPGLKCVSEVLASDWPVIQLFFTEQGALDHPLLVNTGLKEEPLLLRESEAAKLAGQANPEGVLALVRRPHGVFGGDWNGLPAPQLLLDGISDPGNLGSILRSAAWFGLRYVAVRGESCAADSAKVIRATMGALFRLERIAPIRDDELQTCRSTQRLVLLDGQGEAGLHDFSFLHPDLLILGSESHGSSLPPDWLAARLAIPGNTGVESLNVGHAFAMAAWERVRQLGPWK